MTRKTLALLLCCLVTPAAAVAQTRGLTKIQLYALQQQLKIECGLHYATGQMDGPTRQAIRTCNQKYGTTGNGAALLAAMNIGFSAGDTPPTSVSDVPRGMGAPAYNVQTGTKVVTDTTMMMMTTDTTMAGRAARARARRARAMMTDTTAAGRAARARARARRDSIARARRDTIHQ